MASCETCWGDAYARARMLGGSQVEHYHALLAERADDHRTPTDDEWCRREDCRWRNWRSGGMPTHRRGDDCPPPCHCPTDTDIDAALAAANDRLHKGDR